MLSPYRVCVSLLAPLLLFGSILSHSSAYAGIGIDIQTGRFGQISQPYDTVFVNDPYLDRTTFALNLGASNLGTDIVTYDVYYGVITPDKTVLSWLSKPDKSAFELTFGLVPLARSASLKLGDQPAEVVAASVGAGYKFTPADALGEYLIFCIVARPGTNPGDVRNWAGFGSKILTVK